MVGVLVSRSRGLGLTPYQGHFVAFLGQFALTVPLSTQAFNWVPDSLMQEGPCDGLASHRGGGGGGGGKGENTPKPLHAMETGISSGLMGHLQGCH